MIYLSQSREMRTDHIDLLSPCERGDTVTPRRLADYLGMSTPTDIACLCGTNCSNPRHFFFIREGERTWAKGTASRNKIRLVIERFGLDLTLSDIAERSHTTKQMVAKYLKEQGLKRPTIIRGKNGRLFPSKKNDPQLLLPDRLLKLTDGISDEWSAEIEALAQKIKMANDQ
ncbi:hypothetical protein OAA10_00335 [bacterium]|nr:hypothetical protein [bacterium]